MKNYNCYVAFLCDLMAIELPNLNYHYKNEYYDAYGIEIEPFELKPSAKATTVLNENTIYLDLERFKDEMDIYISLAHEVRHCAQYQATEDIGLADIATPNLINQWKKEFKQYSASDVEEYENQSIELDANAFAWFIGRAVFNIEVTVNCNQNLLMQYKRYIANTFSLDEVKECLEYSDFQYSRNNA